MEEKRTLQPPEPTCENDPLRTLGGGEAKCMVRPCVASGFAELAVSGLASMYPAFDWSICSGPSWISARVRSRYREGLDWSVRMRREDRTSISSHPLADLGWKLLIGYVIACSSYRAVPLFEPRAVPSSRPAERRSRRAQGRSRPAVALGLRLAPALPGCALTAPSTARGSSGSDACIVSPRQLEGPSL